MTIYQAAHHCRHLTCAVVLYCLSAAKADIPPAGAVCGVVHPFAPFTALLLLCERAASSSPHLRGGKNVCPLCSTTVRAHTHTHVALSLFYCSVNVPPPLDFSLCLDCSKKVRSLLKQEKDHYVLQCAFRFFLFLRYCLCDHPISVFTPRPPICKK